MPPVKSPSFYHERPLLLHGATAQQLPTTASHRGPAAAVVLKTHDDGVKTQNLTVPESVPQLAVTCADYSKSMHRKYRDSSSCRKRRDSSPLEKAADIGVCELSDALLEPVKEKKPQKQHWKSSAKDVAAAGMAVAGGSAWLFRETARQQRERNSSSISSCKLPPAAADRRRKHSSKSSTRRRRSRHKRKSSSSSSHLMKERERRNSSRSSHHNDGGRFSTRELERTRHRRSTTPSSQSSSSRSRSRSDSGGGGQTSEVSSYRTSSSGGEVQQQPEAAAATDRRRETTTERRRRRRAEEERRAAILWETHDSPPRSFSRHEVSSLDPSEIYSATNAREASTPVTSWLQQFLRKKKEKERQQKQQHQTAALLLLLLLGPLRAGARMVSKIFSRKKKGLVLPRLARQSLLPAAAEQAPRRSNSFVALQQQQQREAWACSTIEQQQQQQLLLEEGENNENTSLEKHGVVSLLRNRREVDAGDPNTTTAAASLRAETAILSAEASSEEEDNMPRNFQEHEGEADEEQQRLEMEQQQQELAEEQATGRQHQRGQLLVLPWSKEPPPQRPGALQLLPPSSRTGKKRDSGRKWRVGPSSYLRLCDKKENKSEEYLLDSDMLFVATTTPTRTNKSPGGKNLAAFNRFSAALPTAVAAVPTAVAAVPTAAASCAPHFFAKMTARDSPAAMKRTSASAIGAVGEVCTYKAAGSTAGEQNGEEKEEKMRLQGGSQSFLRAPLTQWQQKQRQKKRATPLTCGADETSVATAAACLTTTTTTPMPPEGEVVCNFPLLLADGGRVSTAAISGGKRRDGRQSHDQKSSSSPTAANAILTTEQQQQQLHLLLSSQRDEKKKSLVKAVVAADPAATGETGERAAGLQQWQKEDGVSVTTRWTTRHDDSSWGFEEEGEEKTTVTAADQKPHQQPPRLFSWGGRETGLRRRVAGCGVVAEKKLPPASSMLLPLREQRARRLRTYVVIEIREGAHRILELQVAEMLTRIEELCAADERGQLLHRQRRLQRMYEKKNSSTSSSSSTSQASHKQQHRRRSTRTRSTCGSSHNNSGGRRRRRSARYRSSSSSFSNKSRQRLFSEKYRKKRQRGRRGPIIGSSKRRSSSSNSTSTSFKWGRRVGVDRKNDSSSGDGSPSKNAFLNHPCGVGRLKQRSRQSSVKRLLRRARGHRRRDRKNHSRNTSEHSSNTDSSRCCSAVVGEKTSKDKKLPDASSSSGTARAAPLPGSFLHKSRKKAFAACDRVTQIHGGEMYIDGGNAAATMGNATSNTTTGVDTHCSSIAVVTASQVWAPDSPEGNNDTGGSTSKNSSNAVSNVALPPTAAATFCPSTTSVFALGGVNDVAPAAALQSLQKGRQNRCSNNSSSSSHPTEHSEEAVSHGVQRRRLPQRRRRKNVLACSRSSSRHSGGEEAGGRAWRKNGFREERKRASRRSRRGKNRKQLLRSDSSSRSTEAAGHRSSRDAGVFGTRDSTSNRSSQSGKQHLRKTVGSRHRHNKKTAATAGRSCCCCRCCCCWGSRSSEAAALSHRSETLMLQREQRLKEERKQQQQAGGADTGRLTYRDCRQAFTDVHPIPSIEIRRHVVLLCLPPVTCFVLWDRVFLLLSDDLEPDHLISQLAKLTRHYAALRRRARSSSRSSSFDQQQQKLGSSNISRSRKLTHRQTRRSERLRYAAERRFVPTHSEKQQQQHPSIYQVEPQNQQPQQLHQEQPQQQEEQKKKQRQRCVGQQFLQQQLVQQELLVRPQSTGQEQAVSLVRRMNPPDSTGQESESPSKRKAEHVNAIQEGVTATEANACVSDADSFLGAAPFPVLEDSQKAHFPCVADARAGQDFAHVAAAAASKTTFTLQREQLQVTSSGQSVYHRQSSECAKVAGAAAESSTKTLHVDSNRASSAERCWAAGELLEESDVATTTAAKSRAATALAAEAVSAPHEEGRANVVLTELKRDTEEAADELGSQQREKRVMLSLAPLCGAAAESPSTSFGLAVHEHATAKQQTAFPVIAAASEGHTGNLRTSDAAAATVSGTREDGTSSVVKQQLSQLKNDKAGGASIHKNSTGIKKPSTSAVLSGSLVGPDVDAAATAAVHSDGPNKALDAAPLPTAGLLKNTSAAGNPSHMSLKAADLVLMESRGLPTSNTLRYERQQQLQEQAHQQRLEKSACCSTPSCKSLAMCNRHLSSRHSSLEERGSAAASGRPSMPFEFAAFECIFFAAFKQLNSDILYLEKNFAETHHRTAKRSEASSILLEGLHSLKEPVALYEDRVNAFDKALDELLSNNVDLHRMELTRLHRNPGLYDYDLNKDKVDPELEILLEYFDQEMDQFKIRVRHLKEGIENTERLISLRLALMRNRLIQWELAAAVVAAGLAIGTCISGIFGMNLSNGFEDGKKYSHQIFNLVSSIITVLAVGSIIVVFYLIRTIVL